MPCIIRTSNCINEHGIVAAIVRPTEDLLDVSRKERNVHRGVAATGGSWIVRRG
jgi:hypothetical protein